MMMRGESVFTFSSRRDRSDALWLAAFLGIWVAFDPDFPSGEDGVRRLASACSYEVPDVDDIILSVPLTFPFADIVESHHDDDGSRVKVAPNHSVHSYCSPHHLHHHHQRAARGADGRRRRVRRDFTANRTFEPLRIALHYDSASIHPLPLNKQLFINTSLLPEAIGFWQEALFVRPSLAPIRLSRKCKSNHYYLDASETHPTCVDRCRAATTCGEVTIPDEHLYQCRYCALPNPLACTFSGPADGEGIRNADFLLYVSAVDSQRCQNEDTIAYAAHCQQEAELDRPIAGHVNICPSALSTHVHDQEILLSTVKHEILHALGFSAGLYAFFRDPHGRPRTKRNRYNRPMSFNRERGYYDADASTVRRVERSDWWAAGSGDGDENRTTHSVHMMVTERVVEEARRHFNCSRLEGAELENQGGDGTALTHWEKRLFENEAMTGTHTQNPVYSRLTLALMEDSGWYRAHYAVAEQLHWGRNLGCDFSMKSCGEWIQSRLERNVSTAPFCHQIKHDGHRSLATTRCTDQRDSLALCNLVPYKRPLPADYRNFAALPGVRAAALPYYGGSVELADYCPYNQEFEWKSVNRTDRRDSRCELRGNAPPTSHANAAMEVYGAGARCFDLQRSWTERRCGRVKTYSQFMAGCYEFICADRRVNLRLAGSSRLYPCYYAGQPVHIRRVVNGWLREGVVDCPACTELCPSTGTFVEHARRLAAERITTTTPGVSVGATAMTTTDDDDNGTAAAESILTWWVFGGDAFASGGVERVQSSAKYNHILPKVGESKQPSSADAVVLEVAMPPSPPPKTPFSIGAANTVGGRRRRTKAADGGSPLMECAAELAPADVFVEIGDPPLDEPCAAPARRPTPFVTWTSTLVLLATTVKALRYFTFF